MRKTPRCPACGKKRTARRLSAQAKTAKCDYCGTPGKTLPSDRYLKIPTETPEERGAGKLAPGEPTIPDTSTTYKTGRKVVN